MVLPTLRILIRDSAVWVVKRSTHMGVPRPASGPEGVRISNQDTQPCRKGLGGWRTLPGLTSERSGRTPTCSLPPLPPRDSHAPTCALRRARVPSRQVSRDRGLRVCVVQHGSHKPHVGQGQVRCGYCH